MSLSKNTSGCLPNFSDDLSEKQHLLHLRLMKAALEQTDIPFLGLAEPTITAQETRRLHEENPLATQQNQTGTYPVEDIVMNHCDFVKTQRLDNANHPQVELPRLVQYDLFHIAEAMPETRTGAPNDALHSFFHYQEAFDTLLDHSQYFLDRQAFIMLMWHAYHPVWDNWDFYRITKQTGTTSEITLGNDVHNPFAMLDLPGSMSRADQQQIIKRTINGFWSSASTDSKALSFRKKLDHIADFAKALAARKGSAIFRPYHEHSPGDWFWWCLDNLADDPKEAERLYRKLFHKTREYLESQGVDNLLYCYSPDLPYEQPFKTKADFLTHYRRGMPDLDQIEVLGIDAYLWKLFPAEEQQEYADASAVEDETSRRSIYASILARPWERALQMCTWLREEYPDKIVGLTETGWDYKKWGSTRGRPIETFWQTVGIQRVQALPKKDRPHFICFWRNDTSGYYHPWDTGSAKFWKETTAIAQGLDTQVADVPPSSPVV